MKYIISANEIGLLFTKQSFKKLLEVGYYNIFNPHSKVIIVNMKNAIENYHIELEALANNKSLLSAVKTIKVKDNEVAFHFIDDLFYELLPAGTHSFFTNFYNHSFVICDTKEVEIPISIDESIFQSKKFLEKNKQLNVVKEFIVNEGFVGVLRVDGKFEKLLNPGKYYFFVNIHNVSVVQIDLRIRTLQIAGQELLTKDKVTLRMNFVLTYKINDSLKVANSFDNFDELLYIVMQLALREYISTKNLDELLAEKHEIGKIILETVKQKETDFGTTFMEAGVKDIILPGEIKDILNTVLIAEKKALANVITRREETASTRSLLNTAKLMEENSTLYKLKELEYLERICDKVGNISLSSSGGILEQLSELIKKSI